MHPTGETTCTRRWRVADLTSGVGAVVLGIGLGSLFANVFTRAKVWILLAGIVTHGWGMFDKHRLEKDAAAAELPWAPALYWICWVTLAILAVVLVVR